ncbi:MAG: HAD-IIA family hydrolase [Chloroflexaceae bacterium]
MIDFTSVRTLLFDMDGVLYRGKTQLPGARDMLAFCERVGIAYACITNNSTNTPQRYEQKLAEMGMSVPAERVLTSALVTGRYLRNHYPRGTTVYPIGMEGLHRALFDDDYFVLEEAEPQLVVQGADFDIGYEKLKRGCLAIRAGARFISTNPDKTFPSEEGLIPGAGALLAALQAASGVEPEVIGKPQPTMFRVALELLDSSPEQALVVGDRLDTDIAGAQNAGLRSLLILTGVTRREELEQSAIQPDAVLDGLPDLLAAMQR